MSKELTPEQSAYVKIIEAIKKVWGQRPPGHYDLEGADIANALLEILYEIPKRERMDNILSTLSDEEIASIARDAAVTENAARSVIKLILEEMPCDNDIARASAHAYVIGWIMCEIYYSD